MSSQNKYLTKLDNLSPCNQKNNKIITPLTPHIRKQSQMKTRLFNRFYKHFNQVE